MVTTFGELDRAIPTTTSEASSEQRSSSTASGCDALRTSMTFRPDRAWLAWTTAALGRSKTMPALADLVKRQEAKRSAKPMNADQMLTMARLWSAASNQWKKGPA